MPAAYAARHKASRAERNSRVKTLANAHVEEVSETNQDRIGGLLRPEESVVVAIRGDMAPDHIFSECYLIGTDQRVLTCAVQDDALTVVAEVSLQDMVAIERRDLHGIARLDARTSGATVSLIYYNRSRMGSFETALEKIGSLLPSTAEGEPDQKEKRGKRGRHGQRKGGRGELELCPKCGRPLPKP